MITNFNYQYSAPVILSHPQDVEIMWGHRKRLEVKADGVSPLCYQWYFEQSIIPGMLNHSHYVNHIIACYFIGENESTYTISSATIRNAGHYYCQVQNQYGKVNSDPAKVTVNDHLKLEGSTTLLSNEELAISQIQDFTSQTDAES